MQIYAAIEIYIADFVPPLKHVLCYFTYLCCEFLKAPPTFETIMEDMDVCVGETPRFAVVVEGKPVPDIMWYKVHFSVYDM